MKRMIPVILWICISPLAGARVEFLSQSNALRIVVDSKEFAAYVFRDAHIPRPFFQSLKTLQGVPITRNHPPVVGIDLTDHADFHPGLWMAFGDLDGEDFWRNKSRIDHAGFIAPPRSEDGYGTFSVLNDYKTDDRIVGQEECSIRITSDREGVFILWDSVFHSKNPVFSFGDQEEMGLGIRMATPLIVNKGGTILNQQGHRNEKEVWGVQSLWCAYYNQNLDDSSVGVIAMASPDNSRPSWFHARDYGLLVVNPFGRQAFTGREKSILTIQPGERFSLHFGVYVFQAAGIAPDFFESKYRFYTDRISKR